ncbi:MAG: glutathione peroxidase [Bacteroidota bacterium]|nr:glutathione peroxidase [Bacteroidota bacterium]MDP4252044.1 glutathione peroxidase [Bacteroidota bacterium]
MLKSLLFIPLIYFANIYGFSINNLDGSVIHFSDFKGKKILIVNISLNSPYTSQLGDLEKLYQQFKDQLIIIAVPSSSFTPDTKTGAELNQYIQSTYQTHYLLSEEMIVSGTNIHPLFDWLTSISQNGNMDTPVKKDFQKFLIGSDGQLIGVFAPVVNPMSDELVNPIKNN